MKKRKYPWKNGDILVKDENWILIYGGYCTRERIGDVLVYHAIWDMGCYACLGLGVGIGCIYENINNHIRYATNKEIDTFLNWLITKFKAYWDFENRALKSLETGVVYPSRMPYGWDEIVMD